MSSDVAIEATGLSKCYSVFSRPQDRLKQMLSFGRRKLFRDVWAVRDVDIEVFRGETFGIVGRNGSGKSTLMQLVAGIVEPTGGDLTVNGKVSALLELGAGFNPEFTGRENVYLGAQIVGMSSSEIDRRFASIEEFANIGEFIDNPVKTYSSGMYARLAFALAVSIEPDILIVDEILSVGDERFQRKCYAKINEIKQSGATILIVSHSANTILELCDRAMLLDQGERMIVSRPKSVIASYHKLLYSAPERDQEVRNEIRSADHRADQPLAADADDIGYVPPTPPESAREDYFEAGLVPRSTVVYQSRGAVISDVEILDGNRNRVNVLTPGESYIYRYRVTFTADAIGVRFAMLVKTPTGVELASIRSHFDGDGLTFVEKGRRFGIEIHFRNEFLPGVYFTNAGVTAIVDSQETFLHRIVDASMFRVAPRGATYLYGYVDISTERFCDIVPEANGDGENDVDGIALIADEKRHATS
jgi:lipopolysaccharide transport system ATP-binding protein